MAFSSRRRYAWQLRTRTLLLGERTRIMGIVNVTPDSFSDGGEHATTEQAVAHGLRLFEDGADILDIGGESTRPGSPAATAEAISTTEEQDRVLPVIEALLRERPGALLSVDTYRAATARAAVEAGAEIVNDVSGGLWDAAMFWTCAELKCGAVVMHARGLPSQWAAQRQHFDDFLVTGLTEELRARVQAATNAGIPRDRIVADPGFGFGKRGQESWLLLRGFSALARLGVPLLAGLSRKGFLASALPSPARDTTANRDVLTHSADTIAVLAGAHLLRVHDVRGAALASAATDTMLLTQREDRRVKG